MFKLSDRLKTLIIMLAILIFYTLSAYGIWSVVLIPNVIKEQLPPYQLSEIETMYSVCVILTIGLGVVTYMLVSGRAQIYKTGKRKRYTTETTSTIILVIILVVLLIACIASYYYLAKITAPLAP